MKEITKVGNAEFYQEDLAEVYNNKQYVCTSSAIYQIMYSVAQKRYYGAKIYNQGLAGRGRFYLLTAKQINNILKTELLREDIY